MKRHKLYIISLIVIFYFINLHNSISSFAQNISINDNSLYSLSAALIDGDTGRVLYEKNGDEIRPMASTTKIMTLILALEYGNPDDIVTISSYASKMPDVQLNILEGEQYILKDLYYSLMLESHNDVAVAIAEHIGGSVERFAEMMNKKSMELGLEDTYFITPNGLDAKNSNGTHATTAVELARLMKYCVMESPERDNFIKICQTKNYSFSDYSKKRNFNVSNKNALLDMMDGVIAGKTGFTADAGYCYVGAVTKDDKTYIVALLGCGWPNNKSYKWSDMKKLIDYGVNNFDTKSVTDSSTPMKQINVVNGTPKEFIDTYITDYISILASKDEEIRLEYNVPSELIPPVNKGEIVGNINIIINNGIYRTINVYSCDNVKEKNYKYYLNKIVNVYF